MEFMVVFEVIWGLLLSVYYGCFGLVHWVWPDKFLKSVSGDIVLVNILFKNIWGSIGAWWLCVSLMIS